ncbi:hypothetical protein [Burkholderia ubonensis]|uniref:hypothetical protein n=1 Tax=Burkholderia ubonensis TaxID=101571 RepID=UPI000B02F270|nr:hypothetical protein [Burkholderia ubonensis]
MTALGALRLDRTHDGIDVVYMSTLCQLRAAIGALAAEHFAHLFALRFREAAHAWLDPAAAMIASYRRSL